MFKKMGLSASLLALLLVFAGCESSDESAQMLTEAQDGQTVSVFYQDRIDVVLQGNPTTGHQWKIIRRDDEHLSLLSEDYQADSDLIGSPGRFTFHLRAIRRGLTQLALDYVGPSGERAGTFTVSLNIQ